MNIGINEINRYKCITRQTRANEVFYLLFIFSLFTQASVSIWHEPQNSLNIVHLRRRIITEDMCVPICISVLWISLVLAEVNSILCLIDNFKYLQLVEQCLNFCWFLAVNLNVQFLHQLKYS